jgi:hypothetical protein
VQTVQRVIGYDRVISAGPDHFETQNDSGLDPDLHEQFRGTVKDFFQEDNATKEDGDGPSLWSHVDAQWCHAPNSSFTTTSRH